ncbi:cell division protein FtsI/penicillin-binding protein 2 [Natranaerovirga pectinivora]|uniref:Cell division protein FtsI/penicillin-binding protein 2 n=1 Tax=Natranaerovirga pectinivora TaxID=682400 RepID=A0A4R3MP80_9FIRM|nr:penicillin-binding transpeptidase domain-containing protein [Natranaerovirga pectinivora]TCT17095.1 cell division protein FtsI/penicillin-binding protein 2 [Natranaerovirga pectinivora]
MIKKKKAKENINRIQSLFIGLFVLLIANMIYLAGYKKEELIISPYNPRLTTLEEEVIRGKILGNNYEVLAETVELEDGITERIYPYGRIFSHIIGYTAQGKSGIESLANFDLIRTGEGIIGQIWNEFIGEKNKGNNVVTTLDPLLQEIAFEGLGNNKGAIVVLEPSTGKILALVSKPDFNPNEIEFLLAELNRGNTSETFLFNRATQGLYPPGSTFKVLTALHYIMENPDWEEFQYTCSGSDVFYDNTINCFNNTAHGIMGIREALAVSCNTTFAQLGTEIDLKDFKRFNENFMFNNRLPFPLPNSISKYQLDVNSNLESIPETVMGQGKTEITPLQNALITATIANGGIMMKPYLIDRIEDHNGKVIKKFMPEQHKRIINPNYAFLITELMAGVVTDGTGRSLNNLPFTVAGKTGTAEHRKDEKPHSLFIGFAPTDNPKIVVSIVVENAGTGTQAAVPIARRLLEAYFENQ